MKKENKDLPLIAKKDSLEVIGKKLIKEKDPENIKKLSQLFKITSAKKEMLRIIKLTDLLDLAEDEAVKRFQNNPGIIENKYLIAFMDTIQNSIDRASKNLDLIEEDHDILVPNVNILNINQKDDNDLNLQSREKIQFAVNMILDKLKESDNKLKEKNIILEDDEDEEELTQEGKIILTQIEGEE